MDEIVDVTVVEAGLFAAAVAATAAKKTVVTAVFLFFVLLLAEFYCQLYGAC